MLTLGSAFSVDAAPHLINAGVMFLSGAIGSFVQVLLGVLGQIPAMGAENFIANLFAGF